MKISLPPEDMEAAYELVADALDDVPADRREAFLAALVLVLANTCADLDTIREAVAAAKQSLEV